MNHLALQPLLFLGIADAWILGMWITNMAIAVAQAAFFFSLNNRTRRMEMLEARLEKSAEKLVENQITAKTSELSGSMRELAVEIRRINEWMNGQDQSIERLGEKGSTLRVLISEQTSQLKDYFHEHFASKEQMEKLDKKIDFMSHKRSA